MPSLRWTAAVSYVVTLSAFAAVASAAEEKDMAPLLRHEIVGATLPLAEIQRFCETRVPRLAAYKSATEWEAVASRLRKEVLEKIVFRGQAAAWRKMPQHIEWLETIPGGPGYRIKKLRYEALPGLIIPAVLYEPEKLAGRVPVIMNFSGHEGKQGKAAAYLQIRCINQAKRGMLALNPEWIGHGQLGGPRYEHWRMNQLDLCGTSGLAPFYLAMQRGLDVLLSLDHADPNRVAVAGCSGGGWQSIFISSLDPRVTLANPVASPRAVLLRPAGKVRREAVGRPGCATAGAVPCPLPAREERNV